MSAVSEAISNQEFSSGLEESQILRQTNSKDWIILTGMGTDKIGAMRRMVGAVDLEIGIFKSTLQDIKVTLVVYQVYYRVLKILQLNKI